MLAGFRQTSSGMCRLKLTHQERAESEKNAVCVVGRRVRVRAGTTRSVAPPSASAAPGVCTTTAASSRRACTRASSSCATRRRWVVGYDGQRRPDGIRRDATA